MNTCKYCLSTENIIFSGVDALLLGASVGNTCYGCANAVRDKHKAEDEANAHLSEEQRICHTCHKSGQDTQGTYPSFYVQPWYQHADCVDWDDVRKYGRDD